MSNDYDIRIHRQPDGSWVAQGSDLPRWVNGLLEAMETYTAAHRSWPQPSPASSQQEAVSENVDAIFQRVEASLPPGWSLDRLIRRWDHPPAWRVAANRGDGSLFWAEGASIREALEALNLTIQAESWTPYDRHALRSVLLADARREIALLHDDEPGENVERTKGFEHAVFAALRVLNGLKP